MKTTALRLEAFAAEVRSFYYRRLDSSLVSKERTISVTTDTAASQCLAFSSDPPPRFLVDDDDGDCKVREDITDEVIVNAEQQLWEGKDPFNAEEDVDDFGDRYDFMAKIPAPATGKEASVASFGCHAHVSYLCMGDISRHTYARGVIDKFLCLASTMRQSSKIEREYKARVAQSGRSHSTLTSKYHCPRLLPRVSLRISSPR
jgi:hypothetical protein